MRWSALVLCFALVGLETAIAESPEREDAIISRIKRATVASTGIAAIGYSKRLHALEIEFMNHSIYRYFDVDVATFRGLMAAQSKARFYDENVRGRYRSAHVRPRSE